MEDLTMIRQRIRWKAARLWTSNDPVDWAEARDLERWVEGPDEDLEQFELEDWL